MQKHILIVLSAALVSVSFVSTLDSFAGISKLEPELHSAMEDEETANIFIAFEYKNERIQKALNKLNGHQFTRTGQANAITDILLRFAKAQSTVLEILSRQLKESQCDYFESIWISNEIYVEGATLSLMKLVCQRKEVKKLRLEGMATDINPGEGHDHSKHILDGTDTWGIDRIEARKAVILEGYTVKHDVVVASIDTGVNGKHEALAQNYIGGKYGWLDAIGLSEELTDVEGHGTHTLGTALGSHGIGVAPNAKWMACAAMSGSKRNIPYYALIRCAQFVLNPARWQGAHPDNLSPTADPAEIESEIILNIVLCCWGSTTPFYGFYLAIQAWRNAGIIPVFSAGNSPNATFENPAWKQINSPSDSPLVITVGNLQYDNKLAPRSCLGPSNYDLGIKPDLVAPGTNVYSASSKSNSSYFYSSGTSMAAPHVAGVIALILAFDDKLSLLRK